MAVAGVRTKEPATMTVMKGRPNVRKGCRFMRDRYFAAMPFMLADERNFLFWKVPIAFLTFRGVNWVL